jgi:hypothetical protein
MTKDPINHSVKSSPPVEAASSLASNRPHHNDLSALQRGVANWINDLLDRIFVIVTRDHVPDFLRSIHAKALSRYSTHALKSIRARPFLTLHF